MVSVEQRARVELSVSDVIVCLTNSFTVISTLRSKLLDVFSLNIKGDFFHDLPSSLVWKIFVIKVKTSKKAFLRVLNCFCVRVSVVLKLLTWIKFQYCWQSLVIQSLSYEQKFQEAVSSLETRDGNTHKNRSR